jgi:7-carboxy-7-deazaguanine synthase
MTLLVNEIFYSIQGESLWSGLPCVFVRLSGCNLRCRYCDTRYAYQPGDPMTLNQIMAEVSAFQCPRITLTGGEPLYQQETPSLVSLLLENDYSVSMETNGSFHIGPLDPRCIKVMDIKCPSSGMQSHHCMENIQLLGPDDQIKFVIADRADFEFAASLTQRLSSGIEDERMLFSPVYGVLPPQQLAEMMLASRSHGRLQIQLHKLLWPDRTRGV